ncbi:glycosyltransferase family 4 protein [Halogeometricum sp. S1BR25-6]|uniref:Glycosyltransferase family 4 protein n=1 Tax=Halogeometricum salsisoli TaxID=2950536 RepID=A0ABU2GHZ9_9EURY|nr:glycosyltransferase family 4 protein [Halogeometricum sp. S1BR25-6]MDS0300404.1 glycosyltransferase family 4 protein [Halogeometricum sp. S1BR25-6]
MDDIDLLVVGPTGGKDGGIGRYISEQLRHLDDRLSVRLFNSKTPSADGPLSLARGGLHAVADWVRFARESPPDVVHVHTSHYLSFYLSSAYVLFASRRWDVPVVLHVHGSSFDEFVAEASGPVAALQSLVFDACDAVVVLSEYWRETLSVRVDDSKLVVLPNAVVPDEYDPGTAADPQHVVFVSSHVERKGIAEFAAAVSELYDRGFDFRTTVAGSGPLSSHAETLAAEYDDAEYVGYVTEAEKRDLLSDASVYVLPTYAEGLPIAILEAMAGGNAVVSTDVGSIASVVDEANGAVVRPGDVEDLVSAMADILRDSETAARMGTESRRRVEADYAWSGVADELVSLYARLLGRPADRANVAQR